MDDTILSSTSNNNPLKRCSACEKELPATTEFFGSSKKGKYGLRSWCKACCRKKRKAYLSCPEVQKHNHDVRKTYLQRPDAKERARLAEQKRRQRPEVRAYQQSYEKTKRTHSGYREKERIRSRTRYYQPNGKEKALAKNHTRRARKLNNGGTHTAQDVQTQYERQRGKCYYCKTKVGKKYHVDHIIPLARGGSNGPENIVIACSTCNLSKCDRLPREWPQCGRLL